MGKKYIIELEDKPFHKENGDFLYRAKGFNSLVFDLTGISKLTPYTEPDLEQVREEAYEKGYENGFVAGHLKAEKSGQSFYEDGYQKGLSDAWEAARKICTNWCISDGTLALIFGEGKTKTIDDIMREFTASECIEKIRQYEQENDRQARIEYNFDEIKDVLETTAKECNVSLDEIAEVLQKMKESE